MTAQWWLCVLCALFICDVAHCWIEDNYRRSRGKRVHSYPRDWDIDWSASQRRFWEPRGRMPDYNYYQADQAATLALRPRVETRGVWHSHQRGSALVPHRGASVRVRPDRGTSTKEPDSVCQFYRRTVTGRVTDDTTGQRAHRCYRRRNKAVDYWQFRQDGPVYKVCARCPSDRAVLAKRGANSVIMEVPPVIPCHPWSSVEKVKQDIVVGPQPGSRVPEGSHKVVIKLYHRRRTMTTCVIRYNVIVRQCPELLPEPGVRFSCPQGTAWGATCSFSCAPGYKLEGNDRVECTEYLEWTGDVPRCLPTTSCPAPVIPNHGFLRCRTPQHHPVTDLGMLPDGTVCHYNCDAGYMIPPSQLGLREVHCVAGNWDSHMDPACVETKKLGEEDFSSGTTNTNDLSLDGPGCPDGFCHNGGRCMTILDSPTCSCLPGHSGLFCEDVEITPDQSNTVT